MTDRLKALMWFIHNVVGYDNTLHSLYGTEAIKALKEALTYQEEVEFNKWVLDDIIDLSTWAPKIKGHQLPDIMEAMEKEYVDNKLVKVALNGELFDFMDTNDFADYLRDHGYTVKEETITVYTLVG